MLILNPVRAAKSARITHRPNIPDCLEKAKVNTKVERIAFMNNRVLSRRGARELSKAEVDKVIGADCHKQPCTLTLCTIDATGKATDGDVSLGEC